MRPPKHIFLVIIFIFMLMTLQSEANYAVVHKNILIINSYHHGLSWTDDSTNAEINTIKSGYSGDVKIYVEYMDWKEHPTEETLILFEDLMAYKYEDMNIDLIIASDDAAFKFALEKREKLFGDVPIIFNGISESSFDE
ncbi:MAG: diguanylate cyclase, partial [Clostridia bacterium]|nr:diguanylate cyclase [Clostridia bacterium]